MNSSDSLGGWYANRYAWTITSGPIPAGLLVLHRCDNPPCCNPKHLFLGTKLDNARDRASKGRGRDQRGERNPSAKLTEAEVREIRSAIGSQAAIAARYGVTQTAVSLIVRNKNWSQVK